MMAGFIAKQMSRFLPGSQLRFGRGCKTNLNEVDGDEHWMGRARV